MTLIKSLHFKDRLFERGLIEADLLHLLKNGFVYDEAEESSRPEYYKYSVEGTTPNSDGRMLRAIVIPDGGCVLKIVTIMWKDE